MNAKAVEEGHLSFATFEARYGEFLSAVSHESGFRYAKCYRYLKEARREAGKLGETFKRAGRPSRFLESALTAYDYSDALVVRSSQLEDIDRRARVCAAAMRVVREAVQYEFLEGLFANQDDQYSLVGSGVR